MPARSPPKKSEPALPVEKYSRPSFGSTAGACQIGAPPRRYSFEPAGHVSAPGSPGPAVVNQRHTGLPDAASIAWRNDRVPVLAADDAM